MEITFSFRKVVYIRKSNLEGSWLLNFERTYDGTMPVVLRLRTSGTWWTNHVVAAIRIQRYFRGYVVRRLRVLPDLLVVSYALYHTAQFEQVLAIAELEYALSQW